jgi:hypothetical protein
MKPSKEPFRMNLRQRKRAAEELKMSKKEIEETSKKVKANRYKHRLAWMERGSNKGVVEKAYGAQVKSALTSATVVRKLGPEGAFNSQESAYVEVEATNEFTELKSKLAELKRQLDEMSTRMDGLSKQHDQDLAGSELRVAGMERTINFCLDGAHEMFVRAFIDLIVEALYKCLGFKGSPMCLGLLGWRYSQLMLSLPVKVWFPFKFLAGHCS